MTLDEDDDVDEFLADTPPTRAEEKQTDASVLRSQRAIQRLPINKQIIEATPHLRQQLARSNQWQNTNLPQEVTK